MCETAFDEYSFRCSNEFWKVERPVKSEKKTNSPTTVTASWSATSLPDNAWVQKHILHVENIIFV